MGVQREIWEDHIEGNLFKDNEFLLASTDAGQYVLQGQVVHIPQAGAVPNVVKNRSSLPASVIQRTDTDVTYVLDEYTSDPILIPDAETIELSYNKRESVLSEHEAAIRQLTADNILIDWAPSLATSIINTSGGSVATHLTGTTGNRKKFGCTDLKNAQLTMNKQNISIEERYALMSADMFQQLTDELTDTLYRDFSSVYDAKRGILGKLFGFNIMVRAGVATYTDDTLPVVNPYGNTPAATDNDAVLCWHSAAVERALGKISFFERIGDPTFYGDVYSVSVRMGARKRRTDEKGIVAIVQSAAS